MTAWPSHLLTHTAVHVRPVTAPDAYGDQVETGTERTAIDCLFQQDSESESFDQGRNSTEGRWTMFTQHDGIEAGDRIETSEPAIAAAHGGAPVVLEVWGSPDPQFRATTGERVHHQVKLRRPEG